MAIIIKIIEHEIMTVKERVRLGDFDGRGIGQLLTDRHPKSRHAKNKGDWRFGGRGIQNE